jgi:predicted amidohydrolase YtcJ
MSHWRLPVCSFLFASIFSASSLAQVRPAAGPAQIIVTNARIYTLNPQQSWAEALAIRDGKILAVGNAKEIGSLQGPATSVIDARGHLVLPGFTDCHIHFLEGSLDLSHAELAGTHSVAEIQQRLKKYAAAHPGKSWILGQGWSYEVFGEVALPDKKYLDEILPDRPVFLEGFDGHTTWANSKALELAKISRETPDPPNGKIVRDPRTGEPTGALKEEASALVRNILPELSREEKLAALRKGFVEANRSGLVRVHSAGGDFDSFQLYDELRRRGQLTLRFYISDVVGPPELTNEEIAKLGKARERFHDEWLAGGAVKFFLDGVVESHTAAMLEPYADDPNQIGKMFWDPEKYKQAVVELDRRGFQIFTHAIGDRAVRTALDAFERAQETNGAHDARDRIEHIETISAADIPRFGSLGVIASFQPLHAYPNPENDVWIRAAGPEREKRGFAWQSVAKAGGRLAFGSDWPVVTLNPWKGIQNAVTRQTEEGHPPAGWEPEQRVTLAQAVEGYTLGAAVAGRREKTEGSLEPGKMADLILVSPNIFAADPHAIGKTKVLLTMVDGKVVYHAPGWPPSSKEPGGESK